MTMASSTQPEPIAIIGSACRFPGAASSPSKLWKLLSEPRDLLTPISSNRFDPSGFYHPDGSHHGASNVQLSYQLEEDTRLFDASFFSINAREAEAMDPQHRILLETVYECMENAGATIQQLEASKTGVYVGLMTNDYHDVHLRDMETIPKYSGTGTTRSILSNRVSYFFNWKGPSMTIDTACSSSLVAVHLAVQSLRSGETPVAVAAGANLIFGPEMYIIESKLSMLSPHGRSRMWDHKADGYGRGEGVAAVILKTLSNAIRDGDPIECIIRETGVNQDGRTPGITMPSPRSQEALIRETYRRAGLDLAKKEDRPQFFEAHGTGTPVGDPLEAEAISKAFFGHEDTSRSVHDVIYVGGIKTIIGHLEGAAGIASLLKTSLALQNGVIPPNMHLDELNPRVATFTENLRVPSKAVPWPTTSSSAVRRASVNSFGFGGTNAHAILESFDDTRNIPATVQVHSLQPGPFVFSASSQTSLLGTVRQFSHYLSDKSSIIDLRDLAWTLQTKRSDLPCRKAFSAANLESLVKSMQDVVQVAEDTPSAVLGTQITPTSKKDGAKILGIFTGQGAQWPRMGAELLSSSRVFASTIEELQVSLDDLPDGPSWNIKEELAKGGAESRVHLAEISQPICTAVQIALVNMLSHNGVRLSAVVGHSSGEMGAAYSAGIISARDAIRIAYYRGVYAEQAAAGGSMMAVGISYAQAQALCEQERFVGRIVVAASNAPFTVTLSGDEDAINELKIELDEQKTFARLLKVSKAYHSHHMVPCSAAYQAALDKCDIQTQTPGAVHWVSSVDPSLDIAAASTQGRIASSYWVDNMVNPVLFSQAVTQAMSNHGPFDLAIEIGPHAALKGPTTQTIKAVQNATISYHGTLDRGVGDSLAFSAALGFLWERTAVTGRQLGHFTATPVGDEAATKPAFVRGLPNYSWDHGQQYWNESRLSRNFRCPKQPVHELLGKQCSDNVDAHDLRWRNILKVEEMPWLRGHKFQNEILFPAAGHVALAVEAGKVLATDQSVSLIELENVSIGKAITLEESGSGVEIIFCMKRVESTPSRIVADFACYACLNESKGAMDQCSAGRIVLHLGNAASDVLPMKPKSRPELIDVDEDEFYNSMVDIGLDYTELFRNMTNIRRTRRFATSSTERPSANQQYASEHMVHPVLLDICFQTVIAAFCFPGDGSFWTPYLPTNINRIRLSPFAFNNQQSRQVDIEAHIMEESSLRIVGDLSAYNSLGQQQIQLEGLTCSSFSKATPATDKLLFSETLWMPAIALSDDGPTDSQDASDDNPVDLEAAEVNERVAYYYLRTLREKFTQAQIATFEWWFQRLFEFADHLLPIVASGAHSSIKAQWANDTCETIRSLVSRFPDQIDLQLVVEVGESLPTYVQGTVPLLEVMMREDRLTRLYQDGLGVPEVNRHLSQVAQSLCHQHPDMKILEIGAGTGGMTREVLNGIRGAFKSYTFTDISSGYFEKSSKRLQVEGKQKIIFSVLDVEKDPASQGYACGTYDMVIASNVLHATRSLAETVANVRKLLRPGGYLLLNEVTGDMLRLKFIMSGLPGWWLGGDDGRRFAPTITPLQWDETLREGGFSGVDILKQDYSDASKHSLSVIVSQAMDEMVEFLRDPLASPYMAPEVDDLYIVGGRSLKTRQLVRSIKTHLNCWVQDAVMVNDVLELDAVNPPEGCTIVCLDDLDEPVMRDLTQEKLRALQRMFGSAKNILYLTRGARGSSPYSMAFVGLARTMLFEHPALRMQLVDISDLSDISPRIIAGDVLRLVAGETLDSSYLWTAEPEIAYSRTCKQIQRLVGNRTLNDKLNSGRRIIEEVVSTKDSRVAVVKAAAEGLLSLRKDEPAISSVGLAPADHITLRTLLSIATPVNFSGAADTYLSFGVDEGSGKLLAVLSSDIASAIYVSLDAAVEVRNQGDNLEGALRAIAAQVMASHVLSSVPEGGCIIVHEPDEEFARVITETAADCRTCVVVTTSDSLRQGVSPWSYIHPYESKSRFEAMLPYSVDRFIDFSAHHEVLSGKLGDRISASVPTSCSITRLAQLATRNTSGLLVKSSQSREDLTAHLRTACKQHEHVEIYGGITLHVKDLTPKDQDVKHGLARTPHPLSIEFHSANAEQALFSILDWRSSPEVTIPIQPTSFDGVFSAEKTYILFGLSGDLGRSLADIMIEHGARHLVLTSRSPPAVQPWVQRHEARGNNVKVLANDVTSKDDVLSLINTVMKTMPPVGGVVNGAMVLQDKLFKNMDLDDWNTAVRPKIDGSRNLDEYFSTNRPLDFFIMLSSLASVIGNSGQSNYNAGNMYCCALAMNRRNRGLAASVIDIGKIVGIGYVARNRRAVVSLRSHKFQPISEPMLHQMFLEAVISGRADSSRESVLSAGMQKRLGLAAEDSAPPLWLGNPRFSHMKWSTEEELNEENMPAASSIPVKDMLQTASSEDQAKDILAGAFAARLAKILQMSPDSISKHAPLVDIGIDSLIAVEVRTWFFKELNVDVPVLKVIGGASVLEIIGEVLGKLALDFSSQSQAEATSKDEAGGIRDALLPTIEIQEGGQHSQAESEWERISGDTSVTDNSSSPPLPLSDSMSSPSSSSEVGTEKSIIEPTASCSIASVSEQDESCPKSQPELDTVRQAPLSRAQERVWLASHYSPDQTAYNVAFAWKLRGTLNLVRLEAAIQAVINRHEALRTAFDVDDTTKKPVQIVLRSQTVALDVRYLASAEDVHAEFCTFRQHNFDPANGKTFKAALLRVRDTLDVFMLCYHHIIMDGVSLANFLHDLNNAYTSPNSLSADILQYPDFALDEIKTMGSGDLVDDTAYWRQQFNQTPDTLPLLPFARVNSRHSLAAAQVFTAHAFVKKDTVAHIKSASARSQSSPFHFYTAALQVLMHELLDKTVHEFCFGMADSNRLDERYLPTVGFFLNLLPLRLKVSPTDNFSQLVRDTRNTTYGALAHSKMPFDALLQELDVPRSVTHNPLFQVLINYTLGIGAVNRLGGCDMDMVEIEDARTACDLVVSIVETPGKDTAISFTMPLSLYLDEDCSRVLDLYVDVLDRLSRAPDTKVGEFQLLAKSTQSRQTGTGVGPAVEWEDWESTISKQVDAIVGKYPADTAVKMAFSDEQISYGRLGEMTAKTAHVLAGLGVAVSSRVAVLSDSSIDNIVNILAILQLGGTYVPMDPRNPLGRLSSIVKDSRPSLIISDARWRDTTEALGREHELQVVGSDDVRQAAATATPYKTNESSPDHTACILYTSGSTGTPKGVALYHRGFVNQFAAVTKQYGLGQEVAMQQSSPGFDMTIEQIFIALCNGGKLVLVPSTARGDAVKLSELILQEKITYTMAVPAEYTIMLNLGAEFLGQCTHWKYAFSGGERITDRLRQSFRALALPELKLINVYGPTETTVSCCRGIVSLDSGDEPGNYDYCPVGQVLPNYSIYIVGQNGQVLPAGFPGEIFIGGVGVGQRYLNRQDLAGDKFVADTFSPIPRRGAGLVYRTGDRGRLLNDNTLIFLGRLEGDTQIKLRGQRVELDEVANALLKASAGTLASAVVTARGTGADLFLVAFVVFGPGKEMAGSGQAAYFQQLRRALALPKYMWPSRVMALDQLPLSLNGKVDRAALHSIQLSSVVGDSSAGRPLTVAEQDVLALWQEVLPDALAGGTEITGETDFFEVGGNSLQLVRLQALIRQNMGVAIPLVEMVEFCSLEATARRITSGDEADSAPSVDWEKESSVPDILEAHPSGSSGDVPRTINAKPKVILLTGASGFLGRHLLHNLVASDDISEVHCIAIRSASSLEKIHAINSSKIVTYQGDLTLPILGLKKAEAEFLSSHVDAILHNGADVSFLKSYSSLRRANVGSTKELIRLSAPRRIPIHFISSAGVAGFAPPAKLPFPEVSVSSYPPSETGAHGYQSAKWVSERLLEKASARYGMSVTIHRPTGIIGDDAPSTDIVANFLTYSKLLLLAPDMQGWDGYFDFVDVKLVADKVSSSVARAADSAEPAITVVHECDPGAFSVDKLGVHLEKLTGSPFSTIPMLDWIEQAINAGMEPMVGMYLREVTAKGIGSYPRVTSGVVPGA